MAQAWLIELLKGTGKLLLNPVFYYLFLLAAILGVSRVKRERKNFHVRVENAYFELRQLLPTGAVIGIAISIISLAAGLVIPFEAVLLTACATILASITTKVRLLSPAYTVGAAFFAFILAVNQNWSIPYFPDLFASLGNGIYPAIAVLISLLIIGEGVLILKNGQKGTSPKLIKSKRGQSVGVHEVKRLWMLPVFLVIPGDAISALFEWWPIFTVGGKEFSFILVPFAVGFYQQIQGMLPKEAVKLVGKRVIVLGVITLIFAGAGYWWPIISIAVVALAVLGREVLTLRDRLSEENKPFYFSKRNKGLMILGIILDSPAHKMALQVGELITKVNGIQVNDEKAFYEAVQRNRAHCKLEILDVNGEIRFVQRALYEGDHHELGILFVQEEKKWGTEAV
ncbi:PDZ domain-containing protein [Bacillus canaveralius]|uniref:PDZ domain-containing protein n=1 Tax=Bacillus canaveralius TaxID=1403243 RepID=A0A2N5GML4_9BACI|nr:PDZ domain-containing protein [Bacillus canaveralius]PLR83184.1 PDZ domain-containing protein [Bacillus canaveralius]PLR94102.1 PDZ domain-containing protein [Bacillus canaveralius]RSK44056.1 PDZ domain-containing protein [Bacillus canaveralius]